MRKTEEQLEAQVMTSLEESEAEGSGLEEEGTKDFVKSSTIT